MPLYGRVERFGGDGSAWSIYEEQVHVFFCTYDTPEAKKGTFFWQDHMQNLLNVLARLQDAGLKLRREKCMYLVPSV
ncbi:hypothetical protein MRX96_041455 [Rhipicephalus microplus]